MLLYRIVKVMFSSSMLSLLLVIRMRCSMALVNEFIIPKFLPLFKIFTSNLMKNTRNASSKVAHDF
jgi:hypothetical protein